ncbi:MAG: hypothetical protein ACYC56_06920 [Candidatus Aquicultor sp.]
MGGLDYVCPEDEVNRPYGIAVDSRGYVYVADGYNHRIQKFIPLSALR